MTYAIGETYAHHVYASKQWWNNFWATSPEVWGQPNDRVASLLKSLDGSRKTIAVVDVGAGNGRIPFLP